MGNLDLKEYAKSKNVRLWKVADRLGYSCSYFSCLLRKPFSKEMQKAFIEAVNEISNEQEGEKE